MNILIRSSLGKVVILMLCYLSFSGDACKKQAVDTITCSDATTFTRSKVLLPSDPDITLKTPAANSSESCPARFTLEFGYDDTSRALPTNYKDMPINLTYAFAVMGVDTAIGGVFRGGENKTGDEWEVTRLSKTFKIDFADHNFSISGPSNYIFTTALNSTNVEDAVSLTISISYHQP